MPDSIDLRSPSSSPVPLDISDDDDIPLRQRSSRNASPSSARLREEGFNVPPMTGGSRQVAMLSAGAGAGVGSAQGRVGTRPRTLALDNGPGDYRNLATILTDRRREAASAAAAGPAPPLTRQAGPSPAPRLAHRAPPPPPPSDGREAVNPQGRRRRISEIDLVFSEDDDDDDDVSWYIGSPPAIDIAEGLDLSESGSDDDIVITGANVRRTDGDHFRQAMNELERTVAEAARAHDAIVDNDELRRRILSPPPALPPPAGPRPRINLGGAVFRAGNRHVNFAPVPPRDEISPRHERRAIAANPLRPYEPAAAADEGRRNQLYGQFNALDRWDGREAGRVQNVLERIGLNPAALVMRYYDGVGHIVRPAAVGGAYRREEDVQTIIAQVPLPKYNKPRDEYTANFEVEEDPSQDPIILDDEGMVVTSKAQKAPKKKPHLVCANCAEPLLVSSAYRSPLDRVWALRCGHLIDQKCVEKLSTPITEHQLASVNRHPPTLDDSPPPNKRPKSKRLKAKKVEERIPDEYTWICPVDGCGKGHLSAEVGGVWVAKDGEGAVAVYA